VKNKQKITNCSVADPDPEGSETFDLFQIQSGTEINVSDLDISHLQVVAAIAVQ
jgi:hypothetical protein